MDLILLFFIVIPILGFGFLGLTFVWDRQRIRAHFEERGDKCLDITWKIFGKGWFSEYGEGGSGNRIYQVSFSDQYGNKKQAWCKTALFAGVFLTDEKIVEPVKVDGRDMTDAEKVVFLEDQLRKLKAEHSKSKEAM